MKKIYNYLIVLAIPAIFLLLTSETMLPTGSPGGRTGSPGDNGANCTDCHSGTPQSATDWISSNISDLGYQSGETYSFTAMVEHPGSSRFGFELTAEDNDGNKVGDFQILYPLQTQLVNDDGAITHTATGNTGSNNMKEWSFDWVAPDATTGEITFYAAFNATNADGTTSGDVVYLTSYTVNPDITGLDELSKDFRFYPNPSTGILNIENPNFNQTSIVKVFNAAGQLAHEYEMISEFGRINLTHLEKGLYFVQFNNESAQMHKLVIK